MNSDQFRIDVCACGAAESLTGYPKLEEMKRGRTPWQKKLYQRFTKREMQENTLLLLPRMAARRSRPK
jgi:hypothetical protein